MILRGLSSRFHSRPTRLVAHPSVVQRIRTSAEMSLPRETGGILIGYRNETAIAVTTAIEVPDPNATANQYNRSRPVAQRLLDERLACERTTSALGYVGEWHSHSYDVPASPRDRRTLRRNGLADGDSIALIVTRCTPEGWAEAGYVTTRPWAKLKPFGTVKLIRVPVVGPGAAAGDGLEAVTEESQGLLR